MSIFEEMLVLKIFPVVSSIYCGGIAAGTIKQYF